ALDQVEPAWRPRPTQGTLDPALKPVLLVGNGVLAFQGLMTRSEGEKLRDRMVPDLTAPAKRAVVRLFETALNGGLGGGTIEIRARRGSAGPVSAAIAGTLVLPPA